MSRSPELSLVVPVYNEEAAIVDVLTSWLATLDRLGLQFEILVYDDGSGDSSPTLVADLASREPRIRLERQSNRGHGPTVVRGYREARGDWVFQSDGDGEIPAAAMPRLWEERQPFDLVVGARQGGRRPFHRRAVSILSRLTVRAFFDTTLRDVNCPFRLMRRTWLHSVLDFVPAGTFAPNLALTGLALASGARVHVVPVEHRGRTTGAASLRPLRLVTACAVAGVETARIAARFRRDARGALAGV